jgi:DnaJ-class molecular chaperone
MNVKEMEALLNKPLGQADMLDIDRPKCFVCNGKGSIRCDRLLITCKSCHGVGFTKHNTTIKTELEREEL